MTSEETKKLEKQIIHLMLLHREAITAVAESPNKLGHFNVSHQPLMQALFEAEAKNVGITRLSYDNFLERRHFDKQQQIALKLLFQECRSSIIGVKLDDLPALLEKKRVAYIEERTFALLEDYTRNKAKDVVFAAKDLVERLGSTLAEAEETSQVTFNDITSDEFWAQYTAELDSKIKNDVSVLDIGIPEFDSVMGAGFDPETLTVICGNTGGFKSTVMLNVALNIWQKHKKDVLFVGLEEPSNRLMSKILSRECRIPFKFFQRPKNVFTVEHRVKIEEKRKSLQAEAGEGRFVLLEYNQRTTVSSIRKQIEQHLSHFKPSLVVVDYIANLEPDASQRRKDRNDLEIGDMLKSLLKMGKPGAVTKSGFGVVTGAQLNREALKRMKNYRGDTTKFSFSSDDIQGSHQYAADATNIFCLYPDPANKNRIFLFPVKNRYGECSYPDGSNKSSLEVQPEFYLIRSPHDAVWKSDADDGLLLKSVNPPKIDDPWGDIPDSTPKRGNFEEGPNEWGDEAPVVKPEKQRLGDDVDNYLGV